MTMKKILIIFLSLMLAVSCSSKLDPTDLEQSEEGIGGGGQLNDFGNGELIENGKTDSSSISAFINQYVGIYYVDGQVKYKLKDGKLFEITGNEFSEIKNGITVGGNKMQISNHGKSGTIEVLNFANNGLSSYSSFILVKSDTVDTSMTKVGTIGSLAQYKGTYKEFSGGNFLSIGDNGDIYFKKSVSSAGVYMQGNDLVIVDNQNKIVIKLKDKVYRKYARSGDADSTVYSCSKTTDFIESLEKIKYQGGNVKVEFNHFQFTSDDNKGPRDYIGGIQLNTGNFRHILTKNAVLKGNTLTVFESKYKIRFTLTINGDTATYKGDTTITLNKIK